MSNPKNFMEFVQEAIKITISNFGIENSKKIVQQYWDICLEEFNKHPKTKQLFINNGIIDEEKAKKKFIQIFEDYIAARFKADKNSQIASIKSFVDRNM